MPNGLPEPAMQPIHPDKPEPPIVAGDVWMKIATGKTSVNAPECEVISFRPIDKGREVTIRPLRTLTYRRHSERVFRRDWRPC